MGRTEDFRWINHDGEFELEGADSHSGLYFPIASETGLKSCITPDLRGDAKLSQEEFVLEPDSIQDLSESMISRNFWCEISSEASGTRHIWSATGCSHEQRLLKAQGRAEKVTVRGGFLWHEVERVSDDGSISSLITSFVPVKSNTEHHIIRIKNHGAEEIHLLFSAAVPIYGRSADNKRDHRHVTSLLNRIAVKENGVYVTPTMSFDERGHRANSTTYFVCGMDSDGLGPVSFCPDLDNFVGEGGDLFAPAYIYQDRKQSSGDSSDHDSQTHAHDSMKPSDTLAGREAIGAFTFEERILQPGEDTVYLIGVGATEESENETQNFAGSIEEAWELLDENKKYWKDKIGITFHTSDENFNKYMRWITFQPELRRVYGCSFLPHHDYGRGGRGWRDLWQDCLALLLIDPGRTRELLVSNFGGVRLDGTNATIIGNGLGEFKADRNSISRVWMDHAMWPFMTMKLYLDNTGDMSILDEVQPYFSDSTEESSESRGSVLEHLLIQNLVAVSDLGEHGYLRLHDADWNDALDMASERGESVAFSFAYAGNLKAFAGILTELGKTKKSIEISKELMILIDGADEDYTPTAKNSTLSKYRDSVSSGASGEKVSIEASRVADCLMVLYEKMKEVLQKQWLDAGYFNGYFDNSGQPLEGGTGANGNQRMLLTGQVFAIMSGIAEDWQIRKIAESADKLLYDKDCGGYRLNTDFGEVKLDMGRMFGFAWGEKENGAVFSHMAVMYAYALYSRGFAEEGYKSLMSLYEQSMNRGVSHIYPGIPEYFDQNGRGLYHYLTGAASWYLYTVVTQIFGVRGDYGDLIIDPKLVGIFDIEHAPVRIYIQRAGKEFEIEYIHSRNRILIVDGEESGTAENGIYRLTKETIDALGGGVHRIQISIS